MPNQRSTQKKGLKALQIIAISITSLLLVVTFVFLVMESTWVKPKSRTPQEAFLYGLTGTEVLPLPVFQILPDLFPDQFQPAGPEAGDWIQQFGFIRGTPSVNEGLPLGFGISNYRPKSGSPSPVKFVGFNCALCHTARIKRFEGDEGIIVHGMGSISLDFIAWVDALRTALLDEKRLTTRSIETAYTAKFHKSLGVMEKLMINLWLPNIRGTLRASLPKFDAPYSGSDLRNSEFMPNGPSRTQPFRNLVRIIMNRPAATDRALCKLPVLYQQGSREWGQFDGSIGNRLSRSVLAAIATGATLDNLIIPEVSNSVTQAIAYTETLQGPDYLEVFKDQGVRLDPEKIERGRSVYMQYCNDCHGYPDTGGGKWVKGKRQGEVVPIEEIKTDRERVSFRYYDVLVDDLYDYFPDGHPLKPKREDMRPGPLGNTRGYINTPLDSAFSHAPYLHNGSILTMAELINLKPRRTLFYRGDNLYDPIDLGLIAPDEPDDRHYYKFDTRVKGNSNKGHDYPWLYKGSGWNEAALEDLLEFLKTL